MKTSIIIPVIRPQNLEKLIALIKENAGVPESEYEILTEEDTERIGAPKMVKKLTERSKYDLVMFLGDDVLPQPNFLVLALEAMDNLPDKWGLVGLDDMHRDPRAAPTHWLAHKKLLEYCGEFFHTGYIHQYCDNELWLWAMLSGHYIRANEAKVFHDHPGFKDKNKTFVENLEASDDEDMKRVYNAENNDHDKSLYEARYSIIVVGAAKIKNKSLTGDMKTNEPKKSLNNSLDTIDK